MIPGTSPSIFAMTLRLVAFAALAVLSSACTYRNQTQVREVAVDYSDAAYYDRAFAPSPSYGAPAYQAASEGGAPLREREAAAPASSSVGGNALGFSAGAAGNSPAQGAADAGDLTSVDAESIETQELEAAPGSPCYDAAVKAGISNGVCTLVVERKYVLVGEKAR